MNLLVAAYLSALLFGIGLGISGMTNPAKVIGFLDVKGAWDPSLMLVMLGAVVVHGLTYRLITRRNSPVLTATFQIPTNRKVDRKLLLGSVLFGAGWGLGGFCPGPAIVSSVSGASTVLVFTFSMLGGIYLHYLFSRITTSKQGGLP